MEEKMQIDSLKNGNVNISNDVIGTISSIAAAEIKGIKELSGSFSDEIVEKFGKKKTNKGIQIEVADEIVKCTLNVVVDYGTKIQEVAKSVQENVKLAIESMTGLKVETVNVNILGVSFVAEVKSDTK